jgi:hypothetical protein
MRCEEVVSELAAPTPDRDRAAIADHLAGCSACAEWVRRADRLDQLWEATRPPEPSPEAWDSVWANIAGALPCPAKAHREDAVASGPRPSLNGGGVKVLIPTAPQLAPSTPGAGPRRRTRPWRLAAVALVGLAQAAAILVALGLALQAPPDSEAPPTDQTVITGNPEPAAPSPIRVAKPVTVKEEFEAGCLMVIRMEEGTAPRLINATPPEMNTGSDPGLAILNLMEGSGAPQVAAR